MSITQSFYTFVSAVTNITDLLAATSDIYPGVLPQEHSGFPAITYDLEGDDDIDLLGGGVNEMHFAHFEVTCWASTALAVHDLATVVKNELIGVTGAFGANTVSQIIKENELSNFESGTRLHSVRLVFRIAYS